MRSMAMATVVVAIGMCQDANGDFRAFTPTSAGTLTTTGLGSGSPAYAFALTNTGDLIASSVADVATAVEVKFRPLLPTGAAIDSAVFRFAVGSAGGGPTALLVAGTTSDRPAANQADFFGPILPVGSTGPIGLTPATYSFDVTAQLLANPFMTGFFLTTTAGSVTVAGILAGLDAAPTLSITYHVVAPEPSSAVLCGLAGVVGLVASRRRRRGVTAPDGATR